MTSGNGSAGPGRHVLVAGGTGALGGAVLQVLLDAGYAVTTTWIDDRERERVEQAHSDAARLSLVQADLTEPDSVEAVVAGLPALDAVVNLVGGFASGPRVHETNVDDFEFMVRLNLRPGFLLAHAAMPRLVANGGGAFVGVSARAALRPFAGAAGYVTAKAGVLAFIQALDVEYRTSGVRCNAVLPSIIDTPANRAAQPNADVSKWVAPVEIARVVRFLVSDESLPISGAAIPVYGRA